MEMRTCPECLNSIDMDLWDGCPNCSALSEERTGWTQGSWPRQENLELDVLNPAREYGKKL